MITKMQMCVTLILLARTNRPSSEDDDKARDVYMAALKHLTYMHGLTPKDMQMAMDKVRLLANHKPTIKMGKVHAIDKARTRATVREMKRVRYNTQYSMTKEPA